MPLLIKFVWLNLQINIIDFMLLQVLWICNSKTILKKEKLVLNKILKKEPKKWLKIMDGIKMMPWKSGAMDLKTKVPTFWSMWQKESNTWTKLEILLNQLSNGLLKKLQWLMNIWEELDSMFMMLFCMLMLFIEEEVKSSQQQEEFITQLNWLLNPVF
jgi:hypothetical protein